MSDTPETQAAIRQHVGRMLREFVDAVQALPMFTSDETLTEVAIAKFVAMIEGAPDVVVLRRDLDLMTQRYEIQRAEAAGWEARACELGRQVAAMDRIVRIARDRRRTVTLYNIDRLDREMDKALRTFRERVACLMCDGDGRVDGEDPDTAGDTLVRCPECGGTGRRIDAALTSVAVAWALVRDHEAVDVTLREKVADMWRHTGGTVEPLVYRAAPPVPARVGVTEDNGYRLAGEPCSEAQAREVGALFAERDGLRDQVIRLRMELERLRSKQVADTNAALTAAAREGGA